MQVLENVPDSLKVAVSVSPGVGTMFLGMTIETWTYVLSATVSIMFIIEKLPIFIERCKQFYNWIKDKYGTSGE